MGIEGYNLSDVRQNNRTAVLSLLLKKKLARTDLAKELSLRSSTLTSISNAFISEGILIESGKDSDAATGRKKSLLEINDRYKYILSINLHYNECLVTLTGLTGTVLKQVKYKPQPYMDARKLVDDISRIAKDIIWDSNIDKAQILGAGISITGPVNEEKGIAIHPYKLLAGNDVPIKDYFENTLKLPVAVENNICALLLAHHMFNSAPSSILAVSWSAGVGSAIMHNGIICKDCGYISSEIAHMHYYNGMQETCQCGKKGCLEMGISIYAIRKAILSLAGNNPTIESLVSEYGEPAIDNIGFYLDSGCREIEDLILGMTHDIAIAVSNTMLVLGPDTVVLYGPYFQRDYIYRHFLSVVEEHNHLFDEGKFIRSKLMTQSNHIGPVAVALKNFFLK